MAHIPFSALAVVEHYFYKPRPGGGDTSADAIIMCCDYQTGQAIKVERR